MRFAQINKQTNIVFNVIVLDSAEQWGDGEGHEEYYVIQSDTANIGDLYIGGFFIPQ